VKTKPVLLSLILVLALGACGPSMASEEPYYAIEPMVDMRAPALGGASDQVVSESLAPMPTAAPYDPAKANLTNAAIQERMVIMNADLTIVIPDPQAKMEAISAMAANLGGFVVSMNMYQTYLSGGGTAPEGYISIRVPADRLENALGQIKADAIEVRNENRSGQDVTADYVDLSSRLSSLEAAEEQLTEIMQNATETEDVLNVFNQLEYYREQIEVIQGQMQYYEEATAYSLITVTLIAEETIQPIEIGGWKPEGVARKAIQALVNFLQGFVNFLIWFFLMILPTLLVLFGPLALLAWLVIALVRRSKARKAKAQ
jgi:hypothetical protein